ncbi:chromosome partitioning protein, ParB family [Tissierella praeacuta DSM 18095]|uniref:Chromosome partitioning protein, ParB family n=1 Tax=Tissierella praeacuta DSM 18095 TaxID=1123404 RepID=A0A1M4ZAC8_9FIRM|nr:ParB/RepB/Spo0J family partition protein [Tissierella praeacuta]SHF14991.1 chromosome partitioning protein, ParB family [Tissierella praeacuta DSM 18095]SUO99522.1 Probable chromosome-partitioning protein parB [Tissierella praeacuta]
MIKLININKIYHHPDNPRKDLGDLTELAESIRQSGILQNLTVVPWDSNMPEYGEEEERYYAVIGNRRLAAAKLAGLEEVPCTISKMDRKTQLATMLLENMQRVDLTIYEQAQGFQMMLDLGESVTNISEKTGFSESTVRRRMKLLELDQDKLKESASRGATLMDYAELEKIEDIELRNKVLEKVGTDDFNWSLRNAIDREKRAKAFAEIIEKLEEFAEKTESSNNLRRVQYFNGYGDDEVVKPEDADEVKYFYEVSQSYITLYKESVDAEKDSDREEKERIKRAKRDARRVELGEISKRAYELRKEFVKGISNTKARKNMDKIIEVAIYAIVERSCNLSYKEVSELLNIDINNKDNEELEWKDIANHIWKQPELNLLLIVHDTIDYRNSTYFDYFCRHTPNNDLDYIYDFLQKLGYKMSEEEKQLQDGTHELFIVEEE